MPLAARLGLRLGWGQHSLESDRQPGLSAFENVQVKDNPPPLETVLCHQEKLHLPTEPGQSKLSASEQRPQKETEGS